MRAIRYIAAGGPDVIRLQEVPPPVPAGREIRVRVQAAGLNRADILQRRGGYPAPAGWPADIPGLEYAGEVESIGPEVSRWAVGDRVMGLVGGGAHAEMVVVHEDETLPVPAPLSFTDAAAIPEAFLTAYDAIQVRGRLAPGERVLVHAAGSGLGTAAIQVARLLGAGQVAGTSRTREKLERCRTYGLDLALESGEPGWSAGLPEPVDLVLDVLGGGAIAENLAALAPRGRLVLLGLLQGAAADGLDLALVLRKRLEIIGTVMRTRSLEERVELIGKFHDRFLLYFSSGDARPVVGAVVPMIDLAAAHGAMERDETFGKVVLAW